MISININEVLEELKKCDITEYDIKSAMIRGIQNTFHPDLYPDENRIELRPTIKESYDATKQKYIEQFDTYGNAIKWNHLKYICNRLSLLGDEKKGMSIKRWEGLGTQYPEIVQLIRYAVLNKFDKDLTEAHEITDALKIKDGCMYVDPEAIKFEVLEIEIQAYKNRKTIICGLADEQHDRIVDAFEFYEKYNR